MNLPDAIEHLRRLHGDARVGALTGAEEAFADMKALAVCLEALAEHARDGGALLREVSPKTYAPRPGGNGK